MKKKKKAILALEDGSYFYGLSHLVYQGNTGEVCFNTSMIGYQEIITDPSYAGQIVCLTYPLIGNYGVNDHSSESIKPHLSGLIIGELSRISSNCFSQYSLYDFLNKHQISYIQDIDTRKLTLHIRKHGVMRACLTTELNLEEAIEQAKHSPCLSEKNWVASVSSNKNYIYYNSSEKDALSIVIYDFGVKTNILRLLKSLNINVTVVQHHTSADEVLSLNPDGILLSNGPGDPELLYNIYPDIKYLATKKPILGICLGHQILSLAFGGQTFKLKFGHRGSNHPVQDVRTGKILITSQNHGYAVNEETLPNHFLITHRHLNDNTIAGFKHRDYPIFGIQFHPEASPGPLDAQHLFQEFIQCLKK